MANRRKFLAGLGALASGSAAAVGTGAFSSVQAERDITVEAAGDASAYVGIEPFPSDSSEVPEGDGKYSNTDGNGEYASVSEGTVSLDFTSTDKASSTGLNDEAMVNIEDVLLITNNGTQPVYVTVKIEDSDGKTGTDVAALQQFGISGDDDYDFARAAGSYDGDKLPAGESAGMGFYFNSNKTENFGDVINDIDTITIIAAANKEELNRYKP
ncbi:MULTISPECIES: hypothetical protein [Halorubrum]|nr:MULTISPECIES: hypothetical protein [Halorubrum]